MATSKDWQCGKPLVECLEYMFTSGTATDVTFIVGESQDRVQTHKLILISRSPVFHAMLEGPMAEKGDIVVPDIKKDAFIVLLRFLYTDKVDLSVTIVNAVLSAARKYCIDCLVNVCLEYLEQNTTPDNACELLEEAHIYHEEDLKKKCTEVVNDNQARCLNSKGFASLCASCVVRITSADSLAVGEDKVFEAVLRWSDAECKRKDIELIDANRREVLGEILYTVRFPTMNQAYFTNVVLKYGILTSEEMITVIRYITGTPVTGHMAFSTKDRSPNFRKIYRLTGYLGVWNHNGKSDAICFESSENVIFHGIGVYGAWDISASISIKVQVYDISDRCIYESTSTVATDPSVKTYDLLFRKCIDIDKNLRYTIVTTETGPQTYYGSNGVSEIYWDKGKVTFHDSNKSKNGTRVSQGQIPYLILSKSRNGKSVSQRQICNLILS